MSFKWKPSMHIKSNVSKYLTIQLKQKRHFQWICLLTNQRCWYRNALFYFSLHSINFNSWNDTTAQTKHRWRSVLVVPRTNFNGCDWNDEDPKRVLIWLKIGFLVFNFTKSSNLSGSDWIFHLEDCRLKCCTKSKSAYKFITFLWNEEENKKNKTKNSVRKWKNNWKMRWNWSMKHRK